jgi:hypothetical protein
MDMVYFLDSINFDIMDYALLLILVVISAVCLYGVLFGKANPTNRICLFGVSITLFALALRVLHNIFGFSIMVYIDTNEVDISFALITLIFLIGLAGALPMLITSAVREISGKFNNTNHKNV